MLFYLLAAILKISLPQVFLVVSPSRLYFPSVVFAWIFFYVAVHVYTSLCSGSGRGPAHIDGMNLTHPRVDIKDDKRIDNSFLIVVKEGKSMVVESEFILRAFCSIAFYV